MPRPLAVVVVHNQTVSPVVLPDRRSSEFAHEFSSCPFVCCHPGARRWPCRFRRPHGTAMDTDEARAAAMTSAAHRRSAAVAAVALVLTVAPAPHAAEALTVAPVALPGILPIPLTLCGSGGLPGDWSSPVPRGGSALETTAPDYYAIELVAAGRVPGTRLSRGVALQTFASSPFGVSLAPSGEYAHHLDISVTGLKMRDASVYAVWAATAELDRVVSLGTLDRRLPRRGPGRVEQVPGIHHARARRRDRRHMDGSGDSARHVA